MIQIVIPVREEDVSLLETKLDLLTEDQFTNPIPMHIIVVDAGCPFSISEICHHFGASHIKLKDPEPGNRNLARNTGLEFSRDRSDDWVLVTDVDVQITHAALRRLYVWANDSSFGGIPADVAMGMLLVPEYHGGVLIPPEWVPHKAWDTRMNCFCLVRRRVIDLVGGYDEELDGEYGFDDESLAYKLKAIGAKFVHNKTICAKMERLDSGSYDRTGLEESLKVNRLRFTKIRRKWDGVQCKRGSSDEGRPA